MHMGSTSEGDVGAWLEKAMTPKPKPTTAQEFTEETLVGDIETSESRLIDLRNKYGPNMSAVDEYGRRGCRQEAIIFLVLHQANQYYKGVGGRGVQGLVNFAKNVILETQELEENYPSRGLEEFLSRQGAAA